MNAALKFALARRAREKQLIKSFVDTNDLGYGQLMTFGQELWRESLKGMGIAGGEFCVGPCVSQTVPCGCKQPGKCNWCCGSQWLTKHVKEIKDREAK